MSSVEKMDALFAERSRFTIALNFLVLFSM